MSVVGSFSEMLADAAHGPYDFTVNGECSNCGNCCARFLPVSDKDVKRIKRYVEKHGIKIQQHNYPLSGQSVDLTCPFRSDMEKKCLIYDVRPEICRSFKCNNSRGEIYENKRLFHEKHCVIDMRDTFYASKE